MLDAERTFRDVKTLKQVAVCRRKRPFGSKREALAFNRGQKPYQCPFCGQWHLASR